MSKMILVFQHKTTNRTEKEKCLKVTSAYNSRQAQYNLNSHHFTISFRAVPRQFLHLDITDTVMETTDKVKARSLLWATSKEHGMNPQSCLQQLLARTSWDCWKLYWCLTHDALYSIKPTRILLYSLICVNILRSLVIHYIITKLN